MRGQPLQVGQPRVADPRAAKVQHFEMLEILQGGQAGVGDGRVVELQLPGVA